MGWVLVGQVLWRNEHFQLKDVKGIPRMYFSHPTRNQCDPNVDSCISDFKSLTELPYCNEYAGDSQIDHPANCTYADKHSMFVDGTVGSQVFVPTSVVVVEEVMECTPDASNGYSCNNEYKKEWGDRSYYFNETEMQFYANIEDFTVQFTSTYHRETIAGTSLDHPGFFLECHDKEKQVGKKLTWKERLTSREKVCKEEKRMPIKCMPGIACKKGELKYKSLDEDVGLKTEDLKAG